MISKVDMEVYWTFQEKADDYSLHKREWRILHYKLQKTQMMVSLTLKDTCVTFTSSLSMFSGLIIFPHDESLKAFIIFSKETINPQMTGPSIFLKTIFYFKEKKDNGFCVLCLNICMQGKSTPPALLKGILLLHMSNTNLVNKINNLFVIYATMYLIPTKEKNSFFQNIKRNLLYFDNGVSIYSMKASGRKC